MPTERRQSTAALAAAFAAVVGLLLAVFLGRDSGDALGFPLDDAWIHMVYARGLTQDFYFSYNPGVPTTGCTSPLWALLLAPLHALLVTTPGDVDALIVGVMLLGGALHVATAVLSARTVAALGGPAWAAALAGSIVGLSPPLCVAAISGMEIPLTTALMLGGAFCAVTGRLAMAGVWLSLSALARPEAALVGIVVGGMSLWAMGGTTARLRGLARLVAPALAFGGALIAYNVWASGRPLPATFYVKASSATTGFADRIMVGAQDLLGQVPPFVTWIGWCLALVSLWPRAHRGLVPERRAESTPVADAGAASVRDSFAEGTSRRLIAIPVLAGLAFVLGNLYVIEPIDPEAFYHLRYVLPGVPLLTVAFALGAATLASRLPSSRAATLLTGVFVALALFEIAVSTGPTSRHHHNDVKNINEVQRSLGEWLSSRSPEEGFIASGDAGAIRYFSGRPVVDLEGLNTPELRTDMERFTREHPVVAVVVMPAWYRPMPQTPMVVVAERKTANYTVTSSPAMATQLVAVCPPEPGPAPAGAGGSPRAVTLLGRRPVTLQCVPWLPEGFGPADRASSAGALPP